MERGEAGIARALQRAHKHELEVLAQVRHAPLPPSEDVSAAAASIIPSLPEEGLGTEHTTSHLIHDLAKGLNCSSLSSTYYGFVTGGITPAARVADHLATLYDQNVAVHLPDQSIATNVEDRAMEMLLDLLRFDPQVWQVRTLTTGATAGNVLGLACGRQWVLEQRLQRKGHGDASSIAQLGTLKASRWAQIDDWQVLTTMPHSSLRKAANIVGLGGDGVVDIGSQEHDPTAFDMAKLEERIALPRTGTIVVISCGEVNTGWFATHSWEEVDRIRKLCDRHGVWLHVDGAFGIFARCLVDCGPEFARVASGGEGMELADSIASDGHKMLNVPYDCGFFLGKNKSLQHRVFQNPNAAYLSTASDDIPSPLNIGLENSRRFRALPLYATLMASGRSGYVDMVRRQVNLARAVSQWIADHQRLVLLQQMHDFDWQDSIYMILLFQTKEQGKEKALVAKVNKTREIYVSGTVWRGFSAARLAISNWQVDVEEDFHRITSSLDAAVREV